MIRLVRYKSGKILAMTNNYPEKGVHFCSVNSKQNEHENKKITAMGGSGLHCNFRTRTFIRQLHGFFQSTIGNGFGPGAVE
ncbi:hypothetical protein GCM10027347_02270 [Larkinella harenae]